MKSSGGSGSASPTSEILEAIQLLAETEGIFTEPAGGTTMAGTLALIRSGVIPADESVVVCITGNGYKTAAETVVCDCPRGLRLAARSRISTGALQSAPEKAAALPGA